MSPKDLLLMEKHESAIRDICDVFNYPYELLSQAKGVTYANKNEAKKSLYQDAIIPESISLLEQLSNGLKLHEQGLQLKMDYSHIEALQETLKQTGEGRKAMNEALSIEYNVGLITLDDWREYTGLERLDRIPFNLYKWQVAS